MFKTKYLMGALLSLAFLLSASYSFADCNKGDKAQVLWKGSWYPATVLKADGPKCFIHYDGYGSNWDEWVGPGRIKIAGGSESAAPPPAGGPVVGDALQVLWRALGIRPK